MCLAHSLQYIILPFLCKPLSVTIHYCICMFIVWTLETFTVMSFIYCESTFVFYFWYTANLLWFPGKRNGREGGSLNWYNYCMHYPSLSVFIPWLLISRISLKHYACIIKSLPKSVHVTYFWVDVSSYLCRIRSCLLGGGGAVRITTNEVKHT